MIKYKYHIRKNKFVRPKNTPYFLRKIKNKKGVCKIAKLTHMNTRFQRGAVEITLDLIKGLSLSNINTSY